MIHPFPNFNGGLDIPLLKLGCGWVITSTYNYGCNNLSMPVSVSKRDPECDELLGVNLLLHLITSMTSLSLPRKRADIPCSFPNSKAALRAVSDRLTRSENMIAPARITPRFGVHVPRSSTFLTREQGYPSIATYSRFLLGTALYSHLG